MESKFINQETLSYLQAQVGSTTPQRLEALEAAVRNIADYIEKQQEFLVEYEKFLETQISETSLQLDSQIQPKLEHIKQSLRLSFYVGFTAIGLVLGLATAYFLR